MRYFLLLVALFLLLPMDQTNAADSQPVLVKSKLIWGRAPHNAFTDLIRYQNRWYCVFREGKGHASPDGALRVLTSEDGEDWESAALITSPTSDLRDAKISVTADGKLMLAGAEAIPHPETGKTYQHQSIVWFSEDGKNWSKRHDIGDRNFWLWRISWHRDKAYGFGYATSGTEAMIRFYSSNDGKTFDTVVKNAAPEFDNGNETANVFMEDDTCYCLLRRDGKNATGKIGTAHPPYEKWKWKDLGVKLGGPEMIQLPDGRFLAAVRLYDNPVRTSLCWIDVEKGTLTEALKLPSGGDTSYAGMVWHDEMLWVSYYSSHEKSAKIYLAKVKFK